ncbi:hypothetical protein [Chondrinema litorale]|uniref:hypothetical protein n=1 Tax=Chondrinema litorale TaxID=2994555 RepID=UPI002542A1DB|nr:hypothetical protein [Chondrinema litorale]UZR98099.1 hypothetical protein OQ292_30195 [Chondrinema litorale]
MENQFYRNAGISLITGAILIITTMVLHPTGGSLHHIIQITNIAMISHAIGIFSIPMLAFGFYGLSQYLLDKSKASTLAFLIMLLGLIAAMFAAIINGLTIPYFLNQYAENIEANENLLKAIIKFGFSFNKSLDYVFISACCLAILLYSIIIMLQNKMPKWIGIYGLLLILLTLIGLATSFVFTSVFGFSIFIFSIASWFLATGYLLTKSKGI